MQPLLSQSLRVSFDDLLDIGRCVFDIGRRSSTPVPGDAGVPVVPQAVRLQGGDGAGAAGDPVQVRGREQAVRGGGHRVRQDHRGQTASFQVEGAQDEAQKMNPSRNSLRVLFISLCYLFYVIQQTRICISLYRYSLSLAHAVVVRNQSNMDSCVDGIDLPLDNPRRMSGLFKIQFAIPHLEVHLVV